jgi:hypothetical protein
MFELGNEMTPWQIAGLMREAKYRNRLSEWSVREVIGRNRGHKAVVLGKGLELFLNGSAGTRHGPILC